MHGHMICVAQLNAVVELPAQARCYTNSLTSLTSTRGSIHFHTLDDSVAYQLTPTVVLSLAESSTGVSQSASVKQGR